RSRNLFPDCIAQPSVHRLDMETSGLMVLALTTQAHRNLCIQFQNRTVSKQYFAVLNGIVEKEHGEIKLAFRLDVTNRPYQIYDPAQGKWGITLWEKIVVKNRQTRILFTPITGRTHQLRAHASHPLGLGCPIVGDRLYGHGQSGDRLLLHASYLSFQHPANDKTLCFESPPWF
ncbi:MAG: RluA family pseudouridine synthase, partial [Desulfobacterales bacterium]|nr:RluA family pseudouridine synthase [Desulfobacterales bacterium]